MHKPHTEAAGAWRSDWSAAQAAAAGREINELKVAPQGVFWTETDPHTARTLLYCYQHSSQSTAVVTPAGFSVRSRVYEYGGASFCLTEQGVVFSNEADQQLYFQAWQGAPQPLTQRPQCRYADVQFDGLTQSLIAIEEEHQAQTVVHRLVSIPLNTQTQTQTQAQTSTTPHVITVINQGSDFYAAPRLSPDGQRLAWIEWQRPDQPWTHSRLLCAQRQADLTWSLPMYMDGTEEEASVQQPLFDAANRLHALNDQQGYWQLWREQSDGSLAQLDGIAADYTGAPWQLGGCNYLALEGLQGGLALNSEPYLISWLQDGRGHLAVYDFAQQRIVQTLAADYSRLRHLALDEQFFYCIAEHAAQGRAVLAIARDSGSVQVLHQLEIGLTAADISTPCSLYFDSAGQRVHSFFYPPCNRHYRLTADERPPLLVFLHGGPTSACYPVFDARIQFWTQRGFAVADLNYRGSTGFGRAYRQHLHQQWGVAEVEDICALVQHLIAHDQVDAQRVCVRGASAGGYSALLAIAASEDFAAAASLYGVSDPQALRQVTHKFEADYLDWLLGSSDADLKARAPLELVTQMHTPVIFFQGGRDVVVVPEQTRVMVAALREQGVPVDYHLYPDEGHGFRQAQHLAEILELELGFYQRVFEQRTAHLA